MQIPISPYAGAHGANLVSKTGCDGVQLPTPVQGKVSQHQARPMGVMTRRFDTAIRPVQG